MSNLAPPLFAGALGPAYTRDKVAPMVEELYRFYCSPEAYEVYPDARHFLAVLRDRDRREMKVQSQNEFE